MTKGEEIGVKEGMRYTVLLTVALAGCAVGPSTHPAPVRTPPAHGATVDPKTGVILDSIAAAVEAPSHVQPVVPAALAAPIALDTAGQLSWLQLLRDTAVVSLVRQALANNLDYRAAIARVDEYRALYGTARSALFPELDANGSVAYEKLAFGTLAIPAFTAYRATGDVAWEMDLWGRVRRTAEASRFDFVGREEDRRAAALTRVSSVVTAYLQLREFDEDVRISTETMASRRETYRLARERFSQGLISELDVRQFESDVASSAVSLANFLRLQAQQENQLNVLLGRAPGAIPRGGPVDSAVAAIVVPDSLPSAMLQRRPDVMRAQADWSAALARVGASEAARMPRFMISLDYGRQNTNLSQLFGGSSEVYTYQLGVNLPLVTFGRVSGTIRAAQARADQARYHYQQTVLGALQETSDAMAAIRLSRDQLAAQVTQTDALRRALELAQRRYGSGVSSYLEVLDVERGLFASELALASTRRQYLAATVQLYRAVGGSWSER